jgi:hypothetical protein
VTNFSTAFPQTPAHDAITEAAARRMLKELAEEAAAAPAAAPHAPETGVVEAQQSPGYQRT